MTRIPKIARKHTPSGATITRVERMSSAFVKYHLDDGRVLHRFTREEANSDPHDHPWSFQTEVIAGGYVEEVFSIHGDRWSSAMIPREPGTMHQIEAKHIHRIVALPEGECWTLVSAGPSVREVCFWRFGDGAWSRPWHRPDFERVLNPHEGREIERSEQ